ncbi:MAG: hypothetical protein KatS3mg110_0541 [Pirellulaceae bacterium]|nr:MAG: hypothetical protein KatS3mg110_0541 [Pirellulaceae bacterium]
MTVPYRRTAAFTLVELLLVVVFVGIIAAVVLSRSEPQIAQQLNAAAEVLASDLEYARQLAIANNSRYKVVFRTSSGEYYLQHSGSNPALDVLPLHPYLKNSADAANKPIQIGRFSDLPAIGGAVDLYLVETASSGTTVTEVEFDTTGQATGAQDVRIWLAAGQSTSRRYIPVTLIAATGMAVVGDVTDNAPKVAVTFVPLRGDTSGM